MMSLSEVFEQHRFAELWNPEWIVLLLSTLTIYVLVIGPLRDRFPNAQPVHWLQIFSFLLALSLIYFSQGSPVDLLSRHYLFSAHMTQMGLMYFLVPPLFILGVPRWLWNYLFRSERLKKVMLRFTRPLIILPLFAGLLSLYHFPMIFDTIMSSHALHMFCHGLLVLTAFLTWWPVLSPLQEVKEMTGLHKIGYIIAASVLILPVCALIIFSPNLLFETYADAPQIFYLLPKYDDQQLGGVIMKLAQELAYIITIVVIVIQWVSKDKSSTEIDPLLPHEAHVEGDRQSLNGKDLGTVVPSVSAQKKS